MTGKRVSKQPQRGRTMQTSTDVGSGKRGVGRPSVSEHGTERVTVRLPIDQLAQIDEIIAERFGATERAAVIRELVAEALQNRKKR